MTTVHIPIYCDNELDKAGALLTLKTIRTGFPTFNIMLHLMAKSMLGLFNELRFNYPYSGRMYSSLYTNDQLIEQLVNDEPEPFIVVDSDVVFFDNCENIALDGFPFMGEYIPEFNCPLVKSKTASRLHTAFLIIDPVKVKEQIAIRHRTSLKKFVPFNPFKPVLTFNAGQPYFYDSCSLLYHSVGGRCFTDEELNKFEHMHSGTYASQTSKEHHEFIQQVYANPSLAKGHRNKIKANTQQYLCK